MLPMFDMAIHRIPKLNNTGIKLFLTGPESFTPDDRYILGEAPELRNFFVVAGFNSIGIQSAGGAGKGAGRLDCKRTATDGLYGMSIFEDLLHIREIPFISTIVQ